MSNVNTSESLALLSLREKLIRAVAKYEPKELTDLIESQIEAQVILDAENANKTLTAKGNAKFSSEHYANTENLKDHKTLIKLNGIALSVLRDFGLLSDCELKVVLNQITRSYLTMSDMKRIIG